MDMGKRPSSSGGGGGGDLHKSLAPQQSGGLQSLSPPIHCGEWIKENSNSSNTNVYNDQIKDIEQNTPPNSKETPPTAAAAADNEEAPPVVFVAETTPEPVQQQRSSSTDENETKHQQQWKRTLCQTLSCMIVLGVVAYGLYHVATRDDSSDDPDIIIEGDGSWIDPTTPENAKSVVGMKQKISLDLVFSDEFTDDNRHFADGMDTRWTSEDRPGVTNGALQYYNSSHVKTKDGMLVIETTNQDASWIEHDANGAYLDSFTRNYVSGLVSTWNKFCFTSGMIEVSLQLPGRPGTGGLWPAFWMLGNLGRAHYLESTEGVWPWSYDTCGDSEEAKRQLQGQKYTACRDGSRGRGSPEIDIIEAQPGDLVLTYPNVSHVDGSSYNTSVGRPMITTSLQVAPGVDHNIRPKVPDLPKEGEWYKTLYPVGGEEYGPGMNGMLNNYWYGQLISAYPVPEIWQDGLSVNTEHGDKFYEGQHIFRTEWQSGKDGYIRWYWGDNFIHEINSKTLQSKPGASDTLTEIPYEAMYLILNTDVSPKWGWNSCTMTDSCVQNHPDVCAPNGDLICTDCSNPHCVQCEDQQWFKDFCQDINPYHPAKFKIDYVRVYQDSDDPTHTVGCNPPGLETRQILQDNWEKYTFDPGVNKQGPLRDIPHGGGKCNGIQDCGGSNRGDCVEGGCECSTNKWTGPFCVAPFIGEFATGKPPAF